MSCGYDPDVYLKLGDFGLAIPVKGALSTHVEEEKGTGTPLVLAPEAAASGVYTAAGDVFSWAVSMCMVVNDAFGTWPARAHDREQVTEAALQVLHRTCPNVEALLRRCMKLARAKRPCSGEVKDQLLQAAGVWPTIGEQGWGWGGKWLFVVVCGCGGGYT